MFLGLTIGHLMSPQRPFSVARALLILARAWACFTFSSLIAFAIWSMVAGSPISLTATKQFQKGIGEYLGMQPRVDRLNDVADTTQYVYGKPRGDLSSGTNATYLVDIEPIYSRD